MNIKLFYIIGVEGCGHHALTPAIHAALTRNMNRDDSRIKINQPSIRLLNAACRELWYRKHGTGYNRGLARNRIQAIMEDLDKEATIHQKTQILILDNSFPSVSFRTVNEQWDLEELTEIISPYVDIYLLGLYREPIATTFSHREWDGGLQGHAVIIATFLEYLHKKLSALGKYNLKVVHYEDLVNRTRELVIPIASYLDIDPSDVETGLGNIRKSDKDWKKDLTEHEKHWIMSFFNEERIVRWPVFLERSRNLLT